jgi:hypothetical protein
MAFQFLDLVLAACAVLGQIPGGVNGDIAATQQPICRSFEMTTQTSDENERLKVLLNQSEDLREMPVEWRRGGWFPGRHLTWGWHWSDETRQLSWAWHYRWAVPHLTYQRVEGDIGP